MCTRPIEQDGKTFACRICDECIATRRHDWVARAMMERQDHSHTDCVTLTYSEDTTESRDGARMFAYHDVRLFMDRLRKAARYEAKKGKWNFVPQVRFLCAGEQGDRNGRCHWHMILYTNFDLARLGQYRLRGKLVSHRRDMLTEGKRKRRLNWTLWPHGFMTLQEADQGSMNYVLSYCLKDQFTHEKSHGTMREAKAENFATGLFRMSKRPAIGEAWLYRKLEALDATHSVLPSLNIKVPDFHGYYHPSGGFREKLLWALVALNRRGVWATGADAPQWPSLLSACADNPADMEILLGPEKEDEREESIDHELAKRSREIGGYQARAAFVRRCGNQLPCRDCLHQLSDGTLAGLGVVRQWPEVGGEWTYTHAEGYASVPERQHTPGDGLNLYCRAGGSKTARFAFPASHTQGTRPGTGSGHL